MQDASAADSPLAWTPAPWANRACKRLLLLLVWGGTALAIAGSMVAVAIWREGLLFPGLLLGWLFVLGAVVVHEGGHVLGARAGRMTVLTVHIGRWQFKALRRGWRVRRAKEKAKLAGQVMAFPDPNVPLRRAMMLMTIGGPAANLTIGGLSGLLSAAIWTASASAGWALASFATINLALGVANLLPSQLPAATDGLHLLRWRRLRDESAPELAFVRLNGMAVLGRTADELPAEQVALLETLPAPMPLVHLWFVLKGHQNRLDWAQAAAVHTLLEERLAATDPLFVAALKPFISQLRCEIRFSSDMAGVADSLPLDHELDPEVDWQAPALRPRCLALMAKRAGDDAKARYLLDQAQAHAERSVDRASERSEARLRDAVLAVQ